MSLPVYSTGTVSVAAGDTVVTGSGGLWSGTNVKQGDFISIAGSTAVLITEVTDANHLKIAPWPGAAQTAAGYLIYQNYVGRVVGVAAAEDVSIMLEKLHVDGLPFIVGATETVPDPSYGDEGQLAFKPSTGQWWIKQGGVWVPTLGLTALGYGGTSVTTNTIGLGNKTFTTQPSLAYNGARVRAAYSAGINAFVEGVATYSGTTLTIAADTVGGSGSYSTWLFSIAGQPGITGPAGPVGPLGGTFPDAPSDGILYGRRNAAWSSAIGGVYINVKNYGAIGDGVANDYAAIVAADNAAHVKGNALFFPAGAYNIGNNTWTPNQGTRIIGESYASTYLYTGSATADVIRLANGFEQIENLQIVSSVARTGGSYINITGSSARLCNVNLNAPFVGITLGASVADVHLADVGITPVTTTGTGIDVFGGLLIQFHSVVVNGYGCAVGLNLHNSGDITMVDCQFMGAVRNLLAAPNTGQAVMSILAIGCWFDQASGDNILLTTGNGGSIYRCAFFDGWAAGGVTHSNSGFNLSGALDGITISGMDLFDCTYGIAIDGAQNTIITNNRIAGNTVGINLVNGGGAIVTGNRIGPTGGYAANGNGLSLYGTTDNVTIADNSFLGNPVVQSTSGKNISWGNNLGVSGWQAFTPVVVPQGGTFTALGAVSAGYMLSGSMVFWSIRIPITTNGTAFGDIRVTNLPFACVNKHFSGTGRDVSIGSMVQIWVPASSNIILLTKPDGLYPGHDGADIIASGVYERA